MPLAPALPVLRMFSADKAKAFYLDFLQMQGQDPFGNRLRFCQQIDDEANP
ncbi:hypothetical protein ABGT18_03575 [Pseudomonas putida]|jgi:hypothetical protein|uniref:hypothetical protein n=1 Tax=Pseudomonas TaxID=286 RepID=UPI0003AEE7A8|nr:MULTISPECIES: hypothetical protein [Pseudomonas]EKT4455307.1 hypothetical protein [Pseudomonas putida]EKT4471421.1 hypothetical protein [Pseudomonas putida]EKT4493634.1 hypothetical protein [Pseudomonas putida]EKT4512673.1 hypothetical protein [Pseudomonas putida]EKT4530876.1 hypothetical protein [Pseudomonas putida]